MDSRGCGLRLMGWAWGAVVASLLSMTGQAWGNATFCCTDTQSPPRWTSPYVSTDYCDGTTKRISSWYESKSAAQAACTSPWFDCSDQNVTWCSEHNTLWGGFIWANKDGGSNGCGGTWTSNAMYYPKSSYSAQCLVTDTDDDGLNDDIDPYPSDASSFTWRKWYEIRDENGVLKATAVRTDRGDNFWLGDMDYAEDCIEQTVPCKTRMYAATDSGYDKTVGDWASQFGDSTLNPAGPSVGQSMEVIDGEGQVTPASGIESGVSPETGDTDSELLEKIVTNTGRGTSNMQAIADRLKALEGVSRYAMGDGIGGGGSGGATSAETVGAGVANGLASYGASSEAATASENADGIAGMNAVGALTAYTGDDVPEKSTLHDVWDGFLSGNPVSTLLSGSSVQLSNQSCSFSTTVEVGTVSRNITFSFCDWVNSVDLLGTFVYGISVLSGLLLIATGKI